MGDEKKPLRANTNTARRPPGTATGMRVDFASEQGAAITLFQCAYKPNLKRIAVAIRFRSRTDPEKTSPDGRRGRPTEYCLAATR